jgi:hypothetical protein
MGLFVGFLNDKAQLLDAQGVPPRVMTSGNAHKRTTTLVSVSVSVDGLQLTNLEASTHGQREEKRQYDGKDRFRSGESSHAGRPAIAGPG